MVWCGLQVGTLLLRDVSAMFGVHNFPSWMNDSGFLPHHSAHHVTFAVSRSSCILPHSVLVAAKSINSFFYCVFAHSYCWKQILSHERPYAT